LQSQADQLTDARQTIARQQEQLSRVESSRTVGQNRSVEQINSLQQQLAVLTAKDAQQNDKLQMWKQLAEERQAEIRKLQIELQASKAVSPESAEKKGNFLGIF
jgi:hypothetical protein